MKVGDRVGVVKVLNADDKNGIELGMLGTVCNTDVYGVIIVDFDKLKYDPHELNFTNGGYQMYSEQLKVIREEFEVGQLMVITNSNRHHFKVGAIVEYVRPYMYGSYWLKDKEFEQIVHRNDFKPYDDIKIYPPKREERIDTIISKLLELTILVDELKK